MAQAQLNMPFPRYEGEGEQAVLSSVVNNYLSRDNIRAAGLARAMEGEARSLGGDTEPFVGETRDAGVPNVVRARSRRRIVTSDDEDEAVPAPVVAEEPMPQLPSEEEEDAIDVADFDPSTIATVPNRSVQANHWVFTLNNPGVESNALEFVENIFNRGNVKYIVVGSEIAPSGTPHYQGYMREHFIPIQQWLQLLSRAEGMEVGCEVSLNGEHHYFL